MSLFRTMAIRIFPTPLVRKIRIANEARVLNAVEQIKCDFSAADVVDETEIKEALSSTVFETDWHEISVKLAEFGIQQEEGGINPGDRRALYSLLRHRTPGRVLEIGTDLGYSTVSMALALQETLKPEQAPLLTTLDIRDVNDPVVRPWQGRGATYSPAELLRFFGLEDLVKFELGESSKYLKRTERHFDLIFLDGDHSSHGAYRDLCLAMGRLAPGGLILLHDDYPDFLPLWPGEEIIPGPRLAIERVLTENPAATIFPLRRLPWITKAASKATSLSILGRR